MRFAFTPCSTKDIEKVLDHIFTNLLESEEDLRSHSNNVLMLVGPSVTENELFQHIEDLMVVHPGRYFMLEVNETDPDLMRIEVAGVCHSVDKKTNLCSDVVSFKVSSNNLAAIPSLVMSLAHTGRSFGTYIMRDFSISEEVMSLIEIADFLVFDSYHMRKQSIRFDVVFSNVSKLIDVQWLRLSAWRDQIKLTFDVPVAQNLLEHLVKIEYRGGEACSADVNTWLFLSWLTSCLDLRMAPDLDGRYILVGMDGREVELSIEEKGCSDRGLPVGVSFKFSAPLESSIEIEFKPGILNSIINAVEKVVVSSQVTRLSSPDLVKNYFERGETIARYKGYLERALNLAHTV